MRRHSVSLENKLLAKQDLFTKQNDVIFVTLLSWYSVVFSIANRILTDKTTQRRVHKTQLNVYLPIIENIGTTIEHQMAGCQRGLSLSKLATHGYNNVITTHINA